MSKLPSLEAVKAAIIKETHGLLLELTENPRPCSEDREHLYDVVRRNAMILEDLIVDDLYYVIKQLMIEKEKD
jgi:hypothetical protein